MASAFRDGLFALTAAASALTQDHVGFQPDLAAVLLGIPLSGRTANEEPSAAGLLIPEAPLVEAALGRELLLTEVPDDLPAGTAQRDAWTCCRLHQGLEFGLDALGLGPAPPGRVGQKVKDDRPARVGAVVVVD